MLRATIVSVVLVLATSLAAFGATVKKLAFEEVVRDAGRIVHGTVVAIRSSRDESGLPATWITLSVSRTLKGASASQLTFKQFGVAEPLPDGTVTNPGLPRYHVGEEVVLFLYGESRRGFTSPVGFGQGAYRVSRKGKSAQVRSDLGGPAPINLDKFLAEVAGLVAHSPLHDAPRRRQRVGSR